MLRRRITRRKALRTIGMGSVVLISGAYRQIFPDKKHIITLSYDDGFEKSSIKTAEIYEKYGLSACINVIATGHDKPYGLPDEYHNWPQGGFDLWNDLKSRGHEIMPHGYKHQNLAQTSIEEARNLITKCLDIFSSELDGFEAIKSIFNFPTSGTLAISHPLF